MLIAAEVLQWVKMFTSNVHLILFSYLPFHILPRASNDLIVTYLSSIQHTFSSLFYIPPRPSPSLPLIGPPFLSLFRCQDLLMVLDPIS